MSDREKRAERLVYIRWLDAQGDHGQMTKEELAAMGELSVESAGILISEDDTVVRFTGDILHYDMGDKYRDTNVIPKKYIVEMQTFDI